MPYPADPKKVKSFIQNTLGCTCPDAIFTKQEIDNDIAIGGIENCVKLCIGEKLLIYLVAIDSIDDLSESIISIISEGRKERDSIPVNRFRLVLVANDVDAVSAEAHLAFDSIDDLDDKVHIHILPERECEMLL